MLGEKGQHVVEKWNTRVDLGIAGAVHAQFDPDTGFFGLPLDLCLSFLAGSTRGHFGLRGIAHAGPQRTIVSKVIVAKILIRSPQSQFETPSTFVAQRRLGVSSFVKLATLRDPAKLRA